MERTYLVKVQAFAASLVLLLAAFMPLQVNALSGSSLSLSDPRTTEAAQYTFSASGFDTGTAIACIELDLGTSADGSGAIAGLDTSSSTLVSTTLVSDINWAVDNSASAGQTLRIINGSTTEVPSANGNVVWGAVTNGSTEGVTYFGSLRTFTDSSCSTPATGVDSVTVSFVYQDGELVVLTIDPSLTFSVASVGVGQDIFPVGGASLNTTVASTAGGIDHGANVTSTTNGISAHDLTTATNASGGFNVYIRHTGQLTNASLDTIANGGLSSAAFPVPGNEAWAWTSDDNDIGLNAAGTGLWNSFDTTNAVIASETGVASSTNRVGHQVGISTTTPAGTYTTTIIYTAVATY